VSARSGREQLRRTHTRRDGDCTACGEQYPCTVTRLLGEIEQLEQALREQQDSRRGLEHDNKVLRDRINQARRPAHHQPKGPITMHAETSDLLTCWINGEGARRIMVEAGIIPHETPIREFSIAGRDRPTYLYGLLFEVAYAVAERSANPAALVEDPDDVGRYAYAEHALKEWAESSARALEELLSGL
jgi:hypothetical protein